jgi:DNA repair exonuclease SbcCD ATPase subunit
LDDDRAQWQTLEEFQETLLSKKNAYGELKEKLNRINNERNIKLDQLENEKEDLIRLKQNLQNFVEDKKKWLETRGVANRDEYLANLTKRRELALRREQRKSTLVAFLREKNLEKTQELRRFCDRTLREFDEEGIPETGKPEHEFVLLKRSVDDKSHEKEDISNKLQELREELREKGGIIRGSLGGIPDQIIQEESQIKKYDEMIENNLLEREAAELAGEIFSSVARDSDAALVELGKSLSQEFEEIIANSGQVTVSQLDTSSILITDAGGTERSLEDLSSGTMNSFLFAARLALAKLATTGKSLLALDEPFTSFDKYRLDNALAMLKKFYDENGWQIIVLTKDEFLVDQVKELFPEEKVKEHRLGI